MAEPARDAPTTDKKRSLAIDEDFGKDFLNSWKSSKTGNSMDFDVETVPQNGKSSFNFDKLDDFDLGDGFKKLSSFQMDITDIDFSVPLKKTAKANSKQSLGKQELKNDKFSFMFDFNELDKFDFDTKMTETEIPSSKCTKYSLPPCTDEVLKEDKCLELKSDLVDGCHSESHGDEGLPNTNSLATSTCAPTLKPDGQSHNTATIHESAKETLTLVTNIFASDSVKGNVSTDQDSVVRSFNSSPSRYSSPVKSSNSRSCPLKSKTGSEDCVMAPQNDEVDQHEVSGGNKYSNVSAQVCNEVVGGSMKVVMQKYVDTPRNNSSDNTSSPLLVQDISHKDDKGHSAKLMTLSAIKTAGAFERNLTSKLIVSSITTKLPSKRKTFEEPLTDPKVFDTSKHVNFSPNIRVNSSSPAKSITPNLLSAASMSSPKNSPIEGQDIQKDGSKSSPNLMTLRMIKGNNTISNSSMSKEANLVERTKGNLASKSIVSFTTEKHALPSSLLKMKTIKDPFINLKAFNSFKRINSSPERESILISPGNGADMAQRAENPECSKDEACLEKPNGATELESMEFEVPVLIENNGNAEKAESYSKELEDLCIILKKKHEEAKELLVRALVNNNKLLMLNHPMIEEKHNIRVLQRFASSLQCREHWKL